MLVSTLILTPTDITSRAIWPSNHIPPVGRLEDLRAPTLRKAARTRLKRVVGAKPTKGEAWNHASDVTLRPVRSFSIIAV